MSVEFDVRISKSIFKDFEQFLDGWMKQATFNSISLNKTDDLSEFFVFCQGSIRGIILSFNKKLFQTQLHIRINALASRTDWRMVYSLISYIGKTTNTNVIEEGRQISKGILTEEYFLKNADSEMQSGIGIIKKVLEKEENTRLPLWDIDLVIWKSLIQSINNNRELVKYLEERAFRYYHAHRAGIIELEGGVKIGVWSFNDVMFVEVDYIAIARDDENKDLIFVPWNEFIGSIYVKFDTIPRNKNEKPYYFISKINTDQIEEALSYYSNKSVMLDDIVKK